MSAPVSTGHDTLNVETAIDSEGFYVGQWQCECGTTGTTIACRTGNEAADHAVDAHEAHATREAPFGR